MTRIDPAPPPAEPPALVVDAELVRAHQGALWRYLRVLGAGADEAADVAQEAFVALLRASLQNRGELALRAWLRTTARNLWLAALRRQRGSPVAIDTEAIEQAWARYERDDDGDGYRDALDRCLGTLPVRQRELLEDNVRGRAARDEGVRSQLRRLKQALRDCVQRRLRDEP